MTADVIVIGAGVIGCSIADALAQTGADVTVLDMRGPGRGASQASAGVLAPYIEAQQGTSLLEMGTRSLALYDDFIAGVRERSRLPIEYDRCGTLEIAFTPEETAHLAGSRDWLAAAGVAHDWMTAGRIHSFEPAVARNASAALFVPSHARVGVSSLVAALTASARLAGARFETPIEAVRVDSDHNRVYVRAGSRQYSTDRVVIAAGSWSTGIRISGAHLPAVRPIRGQLLHLMWPGPPPSRVVWGPHCYTVPWTDGSLLVGATMEDVGFDERTTAAGVRGLLDAVGTLLPDSHRAELMAIRVGLRPATGDGLPLIGPIAGAPGVVMATGHYRNGILLAPLTAQVVAQLVIENRRDPILSVTSPDRDVR